MPARNQAPRRSRTTKAPTEPKKVLEPYWKRLKPVGEYEYFNDADERILEVAAFDDRVENGTIWVQVKPLKNGRYQKDKNATLAFDSAKRVSELADDLSELFESLT